MFEGRAAFVTGGGTGIGFACARAIVNGGGAVTIAGRRAELLEAAANALGPSFMSSTGVPTCGTPSRPIPGCVPLNILGPAGSIDAAAASYVTFTALAERGHAQMGGAREN